MCVCEKMQERKLKNLAARMAEDCLMLWNRGDGQGGYVLELIREEFARAERDQLALYRKNIHE